MLTQYFPSLLDEFKSTSPERLEELYVETVDRWTWETGSDKDWALLQKLDAERHYRKNHRPRKLSAKWSVETQQELQAEIGDGVKEEIAQEMDKKLIKSIVQEITYERDEDLMRFLK